jgi:hypothetical protein
VCTVLELPGKTLGALSVFENVAGAALTVASARFYKSWAVLAPKLCFAGCCTRAGTEAAVASSTAGRPCTKLANHAVDGARLFVAFLGRVPSCTCTASVGCSSNNRSDSGSSTRSAGLGASTPLTPYGKYAILGARLGGANFGCFEGGTCLAAEVGILGHSSRANLHAAAASGAAGAPAAECRYLAVNRAGRRIADLVAGQIRATYTGILGFGDNGAGAELAPRSAGLTAKPVSGPSRDFAVNRARARAAGRSFFKCATLVASEFGSSSGTGPGLQTVATASLSTNTPGTPRGCNTVDRADRCVAGQTGRERRARFATVQSSAGNTTPGNGNAATAGFGATVVSSPVADFTVDRATNCGARASFKLALARLATESCFDNSGFLASLGASTTRLGAGGPRTPCRKHAVDGASGRVALTPLRESTADFATI